VFDEWGIDGARLCAANALDARERGADLHTHHAVTGLLRDGPRVTGVEARERAGGARVRVEGEIVVNLGGAWAPRLARMAGATVRVRPAKGVHLVYPRRVSNYAVMALAIDRRWVFLEPHQNGSLLGTTDTDHYGGPERLAATRDDVEYLLQAAATVLPSLRQHRFIATTVGLRPTKYAYGPAPDQLSRDHVIVDHAAEGVPGLVTMVGGKLASYRAMAEELGDLIVRRLGRGGPCRTHVELLPGGDRTPDPERVAAEARVPALAAGRLIARHGSRAPAVLEEGGAEGRGLACPCEPVLRAEATHALLHESAADLCDLRRRTRLSEGTCGGTTCIGRAAPLLHERGDAVPAVHRAVLGALRDRFGARVPALGHHAANLAQEELFQGRYFLVGDYARLPWA
jgi:glycerol-3-phosphate dehydrogenase